jgi:flagellar biogenesis protein FliO
MLLAAAFAALVLTQSPAPAPEAGAAPSAQLQQLDGSERRPALAPELPLEQRRTDGDGSFVWQMLRSLAALMAVLGLIYLIFKVGLAKFLRAGLARPGRHVTLLERVPLDARHALFVVEVTGGRKLLLGSSERGISVVDSLEATQGSQVKFKDVLEKTQAKDSGDA